MNLSANLPALAGKPWFWPAVAAALALAVVLPGLGSHGFWEPHEIEVLEEARALADQSESGESATAAAESEEGPDDDVAEGATADDEPEGSGGEGDAERGDEERPPPLAQRAVAASIGALGLGEWSARVPNALFALLAFAATLGLGLRLAGPRAAAIAGAVLVSFPLFALPARLVVGDVAAAAGYALIALGGAGLCWPRPRPPLGRTAVLAFDLAALALGAFLGHAATGTLLGVAAPLSALAAAGWVTVLAERRERAAPVNADQATADQATADQATADQAPRPPSFAGALAVSVAAAAALLWFAADAFDLATAYPGDRAVFGKTLIRAEGELGALAGAWRESADQGATFDGLFDLLAFGLFPFSVLAPVALFIGALGRGPGRRGFAAQLCLAQAAAAWVAALILERHVGPAPFPALGAAALGVGLVLDDLLRAAPAESGGGSRRAFPLVAAFCALAAIVLARDLLNFPERIAAIHMPGEEFDVPDDLMPWLVALAAFGIAIAIALASALHGWRPGPRSRLRWLRALSGGRAVVAALLTAALYAGFLAHGWIPALSGQFSSKALFDRFHEVSEKGEELVVLGTPRAGHELYAGEALESVSNRSDLMEFFDAEERRYALVSRGRLCPVQERASREGVDYYVLHGGNADYLLLSNQLRAGEVDKNPLADRIRPDPPEDMDVELDVVFDDKVRLLGYDMPERVARGDTFEMVLYYEVISSIARAWRVFVHFDRGGQRFHGDHEPVGGVCETRYWQVGDFVVDRFEVSAGGAGHPRGEHEVWTGFFRGSDGDWTNMTVTEAEDDLRIDDDERVELRPLEVD